MTFAGMCGKGSVGRSYMITRRGSSSALLKRAKGQGNLLRSFWLLVETVRVAVSVDNLGVNVKVD